MSHVPVKMCKKLRAVRPEDTTLEAGIGITAACEADYYVTTFVNTIFVDGSPI